VLLQTKGDRAVLGDISNAAPAKHVPQVTGLTGYPFKAERQCTLSNVG
jgi:hypothetical protein